ncbi:MAG TPA: hypothetical protein VMT70_22690 [Vicinamibacteria bacterium]|nr:hypothetical protein [Vicinamibacteria bacterium]
MRGPGASSIGTIRVLVRHLMRQFISLDAVGTGGEVKELVAAILTLLAAPGYFLAVITVLGGPRLGQHWRVAALPPLLRYWKEEWLLFTLSMAATAVLAAVHWKSLALDAGDYRILGPLPVRRSSPVAGCLRGYRDAEGRAPGAALPEMVSLALCGRTQWLTLLALSRREGWRGPLVFDDRAIPFVTRLGLDD